MTEDQDNPQASLQERVWEQGWDDHRQRQLKRMAQLTLSQKLVWLEEAHRLVLSLQTKKAHPTE